jgi:hypothetical protein
MIHARRYSSGEFVVGVQLLEENVNVLGDANREGHQAANSR